MVWEGVHTAEAFCPGAQVCVGCAFIKCVNVSRPSRLLAGLKVGAGGQAAPTIEAAGRGGTEARLSAGLVFLVHRCLQF